VGRDNPSPGPLLILRMATLAFLAYLRTCVDPG
jgi:hypothetical protein